MGLISTLLIYKERQTIDGKIERERHIARWNSLILHFCMLSLLLLCCCCCCCCVVEILKFLVCRIPKQQHKHQHYRNNKKLVCCLTVEGHKNNNDDNDYDDAVDIDATKILQREDVVGKVPAKPTSPIAIRRRRRRRRTRTTPRRTTISQRPVLPLKPMYKRFIWKFSNFRPPYKKLKIVVKRRY